MFRFKLQKALEVRQRQEKIRMKDLAEKLALQRGVEQRIAEIHDKTRRNRQLLDEIKGQGSLDLAQMKAMDQYQQAMKRKLRLLDQELQAAQKEVALKQQALIETSKKRKTLEILKEKAIKLHQAILAKQEQSFLDEVGVSHFYQNQIKPRREA